LSPSREVTVRRWDLHLLSDRPDRDDADAPTHSQRIISLRTLPYVAVRRGDPAPANSIRVYPDYADQDLSLLWGIDSARRWEADVLLIALGLPPSRYSADDPLFSELHRCIEAHIQVVVAAGNFGPGIGTLSALARVPDVVSVAATPHMLSREPLPRSSRGWKNGPWPTITSAGDVRVFVLGGATFEPGTSFAAGRVARQCGFLRCMVRWMIDCIGTDLSHGAPPLPPRAVLAQLDTPTSPTGLPELGLDRQVDAALPDGGRCHAWLRRVASRFQELDLPCTLSADPVGITRLLQRMAQSMPEVDPWACGAGYVDENTMRRHLLNLSPTMYLSLFHDRDQMMYAQKRCVDDLDTELGCLWTPPDYAAWTPYYESALHYAAVTPSN
jgi:hypothetical protein